MVKAFLGKNKQNRLWLLPLKKKNRFAWLRTGALPSCLSVVSPSQSPCHLGDALPVFVTLLLKVIVTKARGRWETIPVFLQCIALVGKVSGWVGHVGVFQLFSHSCRCQLNWATLWCWALGRQEVSSRVHTSVTQGCTAGLWLHCYSPFYPGICGPFLRFSSEDCWRHRGYKKRKKLP